MGMRNNQFIAPRLIVPTEQDIVRSLDFSTSPVMLHRPDQFIVSDLSRTITRFMMFDNMNLFYRVFPLRDIIALLLSCSIEDCNKPGYWDFLMFQTEERLGTYMSKLNVDGLDLFYEMLMVDLEEELTQKAPQFYQCERYVFYSWWDPMSICLTQETHSPIIQLGYEFE